MDLSQPAAPATPLRHPKYPFQWLCADYFQYKGKQYLATVDSYSNLPNAIKMREGGTSEELVEALKSHNEIFGIPEEISSDGGSQFSSSRTQQFFSDRGIEHRVCSDAFPDSNCRAELEMKLIRRLLIDNLDADGSLNTDNFRRAVLQYRNTPDRDTKVSPGQIIFGRPLRDFTPINRVNYRPADVWRITADYREIALAK